MNQGDTPDPILRSALPTDADDIFALITELAAYERLAHHVRSTPAILAEALFGESPRVFCDIAEWDGHPAGLALWFYNFSTFAGRHGLYLEDLYVRPEHRGRGLGVALLAGLARRCVQENLARLDWSVLDWNAPSIGLYRRLGADMLDEWTGCRLSGAALHRLAERS